MSKVLKIQTSILVTNQSLYGHGKLLLTGEYFVLDGAEALAVPTKRGQSLQVIETTQKDTLSWKSFNEDGSLWLSGDFEITNFEILEKEPSEALIYLKKILKAVRELNPNFLKNKNSIEVEMQLEFPRNWGLGSSSTLLHCLSKWAAVDAFELLKLTFGGSGYDLACAGVDTAILYKIENQIPIWKSCIYHPAFADRLFFIHLNQKQNSREGIQQYRKVSQNVESLLPEISNLTHEFLNNPSIFDLDYVIREHEQLVSSTIKQPRAKEIYFKDFEGEIKSLGAWGGDFVMATNPFDKEEELISYFKKKGFETVLSFNEMIF